MAHSEQTKAQALCLLMLGNTPRYVAAQMGIPLTTCRRWRKEAPAAWDELLGPEGRARLDEALSGVKARFPGLFDKR
jgi:hypothetical protein